MKLKYAFAVFFVYQLGKSVISWAQGQLILRRAPRKRVSEPQDPEHTDYILACTATELAAAIKAGQFTAVQVTTVYIERARTLGNALELVAEEPFEEALALAARDQQFLASPESCGPLHGVPFSVKDNLSQTGCRSSCGLIRKALEIDTANAGVVQALLDAGAVPFVRSSVPQTLMWIESDNHMHGRAKNPWDQTKTTGGSSAGEGGLIAARASPLGLGGDLAGSIRIPCAFCGVYGFKPTPGRVSGSNIQGPNTSDFADPLLLFVPAVPGPMGRCVKDLQVTASVLFNYKEPLFKLVPYSEPGRRRFRIGYFVDLDFFEAAPPIKRAVEDCCQRLAGLGHELVEFEVPQAKLATLLYVQAYSCQGVDSLENALGSEPPVYFHTKNLFLARHPMLRRMFHWYLQLTGNTRLYEFLSALKRRSAKEMRLLYQEIETYKSRFFEHWQKLALDAVICPVFGVVAPAHTYSLNVIPALEYCLLWNLLQFPAGVVPVSLVQPEEAQYQSATSDRITRMAQEACEGTEGMPVAVQVAGLPFHDETVLAVMKVIEESYKFYHTPY